MTVDAGYGSSQGFDGKERKDILTVIAFNGVTFGRLH
jgi:hypothetical protein